MTRAQQTISLALLITSVYLAFALHLVPVNAKIQDEIIPFLPLWSLVSFGSWLLFKLGWGVFTFNDVPQAHKELMAEIEIAKKDLKAHGIEVD
ncbi:MAG: hypothetical protein Q9204_009176 [Flavoplaca sp. TL-2023a]